MSLPCQDGVEGSIAQPGVSWTLGAILRAFLPQVRHSLALSAHQRRVLAQLAACGTGELGAKVYVCDHCQQHHFAPRSCGDRHCPGCLATRSHQWLQKQLQSLLPISYFHCVFTLPEEHHALALAYPALLYKLLFDSAAQTLLEFGRNHLGGDIGLSAVLHTWGQQLGFHPHVHCIVTGGALSTEDKRWRSTPRAGFLFPVKALGAMFRGKFLQGLRSLLENARINIKLPVRTVTTQDWFSELYKRSWVVYAKRPFGGPKQVLRYLSNYTHRVALSNRRIRAVDELQQTVTVAYRDYRNNSQSKSLTLSAREFIRRFCLHILPPGLVRIRHYGILANNRRKRDIAMAAALLKPAGACSSDAQTLDMDLPARETLCCPACQQPGLRLAGFIDRDGVYQARKLKPAIKDST
jgi:hypothetical protein